jgi:hypothetical protein
LFNNLDLLGYWDSRYDKRLWIARYGFEGLVGKDQNN